LAGDGGRRERARVGRVSETPMRILLVVFSLGLIAGCGNSSPAAPSAARIEVNGEWRGTFSIIAGVTPVSEPLISASVNQNGTTVNGTWVNSGNRVGTFSGVLASEFVTDGRITGTMRISVPGTGSIATCTATAPFTGTVTPSFVITGTVFTWENCPTFSASNGVLTLTR
jgi:hypothetical protein